MLNYEQRAPQINRPIKVISISGGKGGVGKTNTAINLAIALADLNNKVLLFDADLGLSNVDVLLGIHSTKNISDVLHGRCALADVLVTGPSGIVIIPAASGIDEMANLDNLEIASLVRSFSDLTQDIDIMIVDTAAGISNQVLSFVHACQDNILVVCNEPTSLTDAYALIKVLAQQQTNTSFKILANMTRNEDDGLEMFYKLKSATDKYLDISLQYLGAIPFDQHLRDAVQQQQPVLIAYPDCPASQAYQLLSHTVNDWPVINRPEGHITFFFERLIHNQHFAGIIG
jgi:flagellar biosynthesis protein FlhG